MSKTVRTTLLIIGVLGLIVGLRLAGYTRFLEQAARAVTDRIVRAAYQTSGAAAKSQALRAIETAQCLPEDTKIRLLEDENAALREQLFFLKDTARHVGAQVIGRDLDPLGTTIIIDQGAAAGITVNRPVIVGNGLFIGKVARVNETTAVVRLLSDFQSSVAATVANREKSLGVVEGGFGLTVRLNLIPQNELIKPGDAVITSGLEAGIPRGLMIGTVEVVEKKPQEPFQEAILNPTADLEALSVVSVIL